MAFSFEFGLAISSGHYGAVLAVSEQMFLLHVKYWVLFR